MEVDVQPGEFTADVGSAAGDAAPEIAADVAADAAANEGASAVAQGAASAVGKAFAEAEVNAAIESIAAKVAEQAAGRGATALADSGVEVFTLAAGPGEEAGLTTAATACEFGADGAELASLASIDGALAETGPLDVVISASRCAPSGVARVPRPPAFRAVPRCSALTRPPPSHPSRP